MAVFSILAVALLYRRTSAECTGIYSSGIPVAPFDVCVDISFQGTAASSMYTCSGDVGYFNYYTGLGCAGTAVSQTDYTALGYTAVCTGETCDYAVQQFYTADTSGEFCTDDYSTTASFVGVCFVGIGGSTSSQGVCTDSTYTLNYYATTDCTGSISVAQSTDDNECASVISCGADTDGTDSTPEPSSVPSVSPSLDGDTPEPSSVPSVSDTQEPTMAPTTTEPTMAPTDVCAGYYIFDTPYYPLDVCTNNLNSSSGSDVVTSAMFTCNSGVGAQMTYAAADCAGTGVSVSLDPEYETIVCDGTQCDYALSRDYDQNEDDECSTSYDELAFFTDRCFPLGPGQSNIFTCSGSSGTLMNYTSSDCSGTVDYTADYTQSTDDDDCVSLISCMSFVTPDNGSSASLPAALLAMVVSAIALIA